MIFLPSLALAFLSSAGPQSSSGSPLVRVQGTQVRTLSAGGASPSSPSGGAAFSAGPACAVGAQAWHGQAVPGGGTLGPLAFANPAAAPGAGRSVFFAQVNGAARNQGIFAADALGLTPIAMGCGGGGGSGVPGSGCGDPSPIGGTFSGFFSGTFFAPAANPAGDVLFLADVNGGSAPRGLFLFRAASGAFAKVAAVGEASPAGGTFGGVGPGSVNAAGEVVFLAMGATLSTTQILRWSNGALSKVAAVGDPAPGGGTFTNVGGEFVGFADGTTVPVGPLPDADDAGTVCFRAIPSVGARGLIVSSGGVHQWYVRTGEPAPGGGTFFDLQGAPLNAAGQIAFFADVQTATGFTAGWFTGTPGNWRKALGFFDPIDGGQCWGLAFSRNPMTPLDDGGDLLLWTNVKYPNNSEREQLVVSKASGALVTIARKGEATPLGGTYSALDPWPSLDPFGRGTFGAGTPGAAGGVLNAHFLFSTCGPPVVYCTAKVNSQGCTPSIGSSGTPSMTSGAPFTIDASAVLNQKPGILFYGLAPNGAPFQGGFLCVKPPIARTGVQLSGGNPPPDDCSGAYGLDFNAHAQSGADPVLVAGQVVFAQYWTRDPASASTTGLTNAVRFTLAP